MTPSTPSRDSGAPSAIVLLLTGLSFAVALIIMLFVDRSPDRDVWGANVESKSAIGYRACRELLEAQGLDVSVVTHDVVERSRDGLLIVTSPPLVRDSLQTGIADIWPIAGHVLVTLPKWHAWAAPGHREWVAGATLLATEAYEDLLDDLTIDHAIVRPDTVRAWTTDFFGIEPTIRSPQLIRDDSLVPLVACDEGILVGEAPWADDMVIVSDPDLMNNLGIARGRNAELVLAIIDEYRPANGGVYIDLALHDVVPRMRLVHEAMQFPFVLVVVQGLVVLGVLLWSTATRFGPPLRGRDGHAAGKAELIQTTAHLMAERGFYAQMLGRYFGRTLRSVAEHHHLPRGLTETEIVHRLDAGLGTTPGPRATALRDRIRDAASRRHTPAEIVAVARDVRHWHQEMIHGAH